jgi:TorA maturation chaperone TorD
MNELSQRESFAFSARVLGALFWFAPDSEQAAPLVSALTTSDWYQDWPYAHQSLAVSRRCLKPLPMSR